VSSSAEDAILTLEPLIDAVREGVERNGWEMSGLQKTTSHQFEGRWEGESTRSAYLFFHVPTGSDFVSIDVYLDETTRGLTGNIALVVDLVPLGDLGDSGTALGALSRLSADTVSNARRRPITLRLRLDDAADAAKDAETEVRFKVRIPRETISAGPQAVRTLASEAVQAFEQIIISEELNHYMEKG
jgi:hypothetical protein